MEPGISTASSLYGAMLSENLLSSMEFLKEIYSVFERNGIYI